ncbi:MAG: sec-independent protein translocase protein TatA [Thermoleophilaceae bacterium]|jgi:sec-independent protein translocase protein TatA|nr:sec-independent protein translocase protein TatA [Thermoleophilaceae bacterium]MEA2470367.1 sec-independent protein translocase protein TatA [Thermoleophilaceae bacterium]
MANIGPFEIIVVLVIVLVIFGPKRLPQLGRSLGSGMREFKDAVTGKHKDDEDDMPGLTSPPPDPAERVTTAAAADETPAGNRPKAADAS